MNKQFNDFAIILTWPDATIRGDEKWMMFFKNIGFVKNLNFKVGHTGVILINHKDSSLLFYDFGRYITPRGFGRARSQASDPLLQIDIKAKIVDRKIQNIEEIANYLEHKKDPMYGEGRLFFSVVEGLNFDAAKEYGDACVTEGTYPYGAFARNNNNCSRFITRMLMIASQKYHFWHPINLPETLKSSPISNLVNTSSTRMIYSFTPEQGLSQFRMNRFQSFWFLIKQLGDNVCKHKANKLPSDQIIGAMNSSLRPFNVPDSSKYLGGVGDGAWYDIKLDANQILIQRYTSKGKLEYSVIGDKNKDIKPDKEFDITYDSHFLFTHIIQENRKIRIDHIKIIVDTHLDLTLEKIYA